MKLDDVNDLPALVAESADSIEVGLKVLDSHISLGGATVDLVAVDAADALTLVTVGRMADDEMLMRTLEAYSWCQDYPDALRRTYPMVRLSPEQPPRVVFIAEQVPEAFLRKARHLRLDRVDFVEFKFGLQFTRVAAERRSEEPARPAPAAEPRREPARAVSEKTRATKSRHVESRPAEPRPVEARIAPSTPEAREELLDGLKLPANGHLSSQWQRALERRPGDVDDSKVKTVREYLQSEFPTAVIYDFFAHDLGVQMFHLQDSVGAVIHTASVTEDLLADLSESQLRAFLDKHKLGRVLRQAGQASVAVTNSGLKIERS